MRGIGTARRAAGWGTEDRPGRLGLFFIAVWTAFLIEPLRAGWDQRDHVGGVVGMVATLAFALWYVRTARSLRMRMRPAGGPTSRVSPGVSIAVAVALAIVMCLGVGQAGSAAAVYLCVLCVMLDRNWALPASPW